MEKLIRPIAFFDLETTGKEVDKDEIVQISIHRMNIDGTIEKYTQYIMPKREIHLDAITVHGITKERLEGLEVQTFEHYIDDIIDMFDGCDISGYNIFKFDLPLLENEFRRNNRPEIEFSGRKIIDVYKLMEILFSKTLTNVYQLLTGKSREENDAHDADNDVRDTIVVFEEALRNCPWMGSNNDEWIKAMSKEKEMLDYAGNFYKMDGVAWFAIGKDNKDKAVETNPGFLEWMLTKDFPENTKAWCRRFLEAMKTNSNPFAIDKPEDIEPETEENNLMDLID